MRGLTLTLALVLIPACGDDGETPPGDGSSSGGSGSGTTSSTGTPGSSGGSTQTAADSGSTTEDPPGTTTNPTTTEDSSDTTETQPPLEGEVLQNDSWTPADGLVWQTWPGAGDCWASTFSAGPQQAPFELVGAIAAIGGGGGVETFDIGVWEVDNQGTPSTELAATTVDVDGGTSDLTMVDLSGLGVPAFGNNQDFALVMCHAAHMSEPSIAIDMDGNVDASRNWVLQQAMGDWVPSPDFFGINGDFILRAVIQPM